MRKLHRPIPLLLFLAAATAAAVALAFATHLLLPPIHDILSSRDNHTPAELHPPETPLYAWITLRPQADQQDSARTLWDRLNASPDFRDTLQDIELAFTRKSAGLDLRQDVLTWAGPHLSIALVNPPPDNPRRALVITAGVRRPDRARSFLTAWTQRHTDLTGSPLTQDSYRGFDTWSAGPTGPNYALSDRLLVYAQNQDNLRAVIDRTHQDPALPTLAGDPEYRTATAALPGPHSGRLHLNPQALLGLVTNSIPGDPGGQSHPDNPRQGPAQDLPISADDLPPWLAASLHLDDAAVTVNIAAPRDNPPDPSAPAPTTRVESILPHDTLILLSVPFNPDTDSWRARLSEAGPLEQHQAHQYNAIAEDLSQTLGVQEPPSLPQDADNADVLDLSITLANTATGLDLERDLLDHLEGAITLALLDTDLSGLAEDPLLTPVNLAILLSHRPGSAPALQHTLDRLTDLLQDATGMQPARVHLSPDTRATVFQTDLPHEPSHMIHEQHLVLAATQRTLQDLADTGRSAQNQLESDPGYQAAARHLHPSDRVAAYANLSRLIGALPRAPQPQGLPETAVPALRSNLDRLLVGTRTQACQPDQDPACPVTHLHRTTLVITLFPGQPPR